MHRARAARRRYLLWAGVVISLAPLLATRTGPRPDAWISGVGVSFFAFQAIAYLVDVTQGSCRQPASLRELLFLLFFFPRVLQGPLERTAGFLSQVPALGRASYEQWRVGLVLIAWGLVKKTVVADRIGLLVDSVYGNSQAFPATVQWLAVVGFAFQIYADFSGYTDMARGAARICGLAIAQNFDRPYMSVSIADFWRRWHISLSQWLLAYLFMPFQRAFGGRSAASYAASVIGTFVICGAWHGAGWTFVLWGLLNGVWLALNRWTEPRRNHLASRLGVPADLRRIWRMGMTFLMVCAAWALFRAESVTQAVQIWGALPDAILGWRTGSKACLSLVTSLYGRFDLTMLVLGLGAVIAVDIGRGYTRIAGAWAIQSAPLRWAVYYLLIIGAVIGYTPASRPFIYFRF
jgi:D-alanyl-lipoteichoic acid acyltransferase DltB (MBOAT superfamily)